MSRNRLNCERCIRSSDGVPGHAAQSRATALKPMSSRTDEHDRSCPRRESNPHLRFRKPSFYPLNYGDAANRQRIHGLNEYEQLAQRDPQSLISTAESVVESLLSGEHVQMNQYARGG